MNLTNFESSDDVVVLFPDTNFFLHGKWPSDLPWRELIGEHVGYVKLLVCDQVFRELDDHKGANAGRKQKRAQKVSDELAKARRMPGREVIVRDANPVVSLARCRLVEPAAINRLLDLSRPDHRIAQDILNQLASAEPGTPMACGSLLCNDGNLLGVADDIGLGALELPESCRLPPEPSPEAKRTADLEKRLGALEAKSRPDIYLSINEGDSLPLAPVAISAIHYPELEWSAVNDLMAEVDTRFPKTVFRVSSEGFSPGFRPYAYLEQASPANIDRYDRRYEEWRETIRTQLESIHEQIMAGANQFRMPVTIGNRGDSAASGLLLRFEALEGLGIATANAKPTTLPKRLKPFTISKPPTVPHRFTAEGKSVNISALAQISRTSQSTRDLREFYGRSTNRDSDMVLEFECAEMLPTHRRTLSLCGFPPHRGRPQETFIVGCTCLGSNLPGQIYGELKFQVSWSEGNTSAVAYKMVRDAMSTALAAPSEEFD